MNRGNAEIVDELVDELVQVGDWGLPVRALEQLIGAGEAAVEPGARAMPLGEVGRAAQEHGDPMGILKPARPSATDPSPARRNDPCPCESGRKYKKCCGAAGGAAPPDPRILDTRAHERLPRRW